MSRTCDVSVPNDFDLRRQATQICQHAQRGITRWGAKIQPDGSSDPSDGIGLADRLFPLDSAWRMPYPKRLKELRRLDIMAAAIRALAL